MKQMQYLPHFLLILSWGWGGGGLRVRVYQFKLKGLAGGGGWVSAMLLFFAKMVVRHISRYLSFF